MAKKYKMTDFIIKLGRNTILEEALEGIIGDYVIEYDSNINGSWEKYASGKLVQWGKVTLEFDITTAWGSLYVGNNNNDVYFPIPFINNEIRLFRDIKSGSNTSFVSSEYNTVAIYSNRFARFSGIRPNIGYGAVAYIDWLAIGRWK